MVKIIPILFIWGVFIYVVLQVPYPDSIAQAKVQDLLAFFIPLFLGLALTLNLFLKNIFISLSSSLGFIFILILEALDSLNIVTATLIIISIWLLISYFKNIKKK